jgi:hypothetical protein
LNETEKPASSGRLFQFRGRAGMKLSRQDVIGASCAAAAVIVIAWMCVRSWGGVLPF